MKKFILIILASVFLFFINSNIIFAQEKMSSQAANMSPTPTPQYQLPYPGLLPDNPLYFIKTFRDRVIDFLVASPLKKAELNLLQADKRLAAGAALFEKDKKELAESTISKGENYFEEAVVKAKEAKIQGMDVKLLLQNMPLSAKKHQEVLKNLEKKSSGDLKNKFGLLIARMAKLEKQVNDIIKR